MAEKIYKLLKAPKWEYFYRTKQASTSIIDLFYDETKLALKGTINFIVNLLLYSKYFTLYYIYSITYKYFPFFVILMITKSLLLCCLLNKPSKYKKEACARVL